MMQEHQTKQEAKQKLLEEKVKGLKFLNALLSDRITLFQKRRFEQSSERYADGFEQLSLFNEAGQEADLDLPEPEMEEIRPSSYKHKKQKEKRKRICQPFQPWKRSNTSWKERLGTAATPSLTAAIMNAKYVNGMPLARQEREFARYSLRLSTKTMSNWIIRYAEKYLQAVIDLMKEEFLQCQYIHCDETRIHTRDQKLRHRAERMAIFKKHKRGKSERGDLQYNRNSNAQWIKVLQCCCGNQPAD